MSTNEKLYTIAELVDAGILGDPVNGGRARLLEMLGDEVFFDAIGRPAVSETTAIRLAEERKAEEAARVEQAARQFEEAGKNRVAPRGVPAVEGADTGLEALQAQDDYALPSDEFGLPKPRFLEDQLAEGKAAAEAKQAAAAKLKKDLQ